MPSATRPQAVDSSLAELGRHLGEVSDLGRSRALLAWDERTMMPPGGAAARAEQLATLARIRHERLASDEVGRLLEGLRGWAEAQPYESDEASLVRVAWRDWEKARRVPAELRAEMTRAASLGQRAWENARQESDFAAFRPFLERNVELRRRYIACFEGFEHPYDALLDDFEPEARTAEVRAVLSELRDGLRPLVASIAGAGEVVDSSCLHGRISLEDQRELGRRIVSGLPIADGEWRLDSTVHPFATSISPGDIRLTTRYDEDYVGTALWSVIHEAGHGIYENGIPSELRRTPLGRPVSLGFHESQSRLWENWVGRGRAYLGSILPLLREASAGQFGKVDAEQLYRAANRVEPSLIRVEADEVTYNLHVALRFELEVEIFEERLLPAELPEAWNARVRDYLGLDVADDALGVLQDVHWAAGSFGYFPTYSLGNVIAAQLWERIVREITDLDGLIAAGELVPLRDWLRENLHSLGGKLTPPEMIERLTGGGLDVGPLLHHLSSKYGEIYGVTT